MQQQKKYYDQFFTKYPVNVHDYPDRFNSVAKLLSGKVLDVACGTGTLAEYYAGNYVGVDISDVAINKAKASRRRDARFAVADFTKSICFNEYDFESVYLGEFLEHIESDKKVFDNILKHCKKNARIVVSVPNGERVPDESHCRNFTVPQIRREYSKYGKVVFHNWSGFQKRILFSIELGAPSVEEMSLVMIVKNEEKGLEKAILSAIEIVDHIVISVDSKSQDNTEKIANLYADQLKTHEWHDDFSEARNFAQKDVKSKWILFLDGHEYIESYGDYKEKMEFDVEGIFVTIRMESGMTFFFPRIYRSHIKFKNKIHNLNECKTRKASPKFVIVHDRVHGQDEKSAQSRNQQRDEIMPKQLKEDIEKNPKNPRPHFHLANYYMMNHNIDGAMYHYKKAIKYENSLDEKYLCLLHYGALHQSKGHSFRALWNFNKADQLLPGRWESARTLGGFYLLQKNYKRAIPYLFEAFKPNKRLYSYQPMQKDESAIWDLIGTCFTKLDKFSEAQSAFQNASDKCTDENHKKLFKQKADLLKNVC